MCRSARSINVCERTDGLWGLSPEVMCRVQRGKTLSTDRGAAPLPVQCRPATFRHAARTDVLHVWNVAPAGVRDLPVQPVRPVRIHMEHDHARMERQMRRTKLLHPFPVNDCHDFQVAK